MTILTLFVLLFFLSFIRSPMTLGVLGMVLILYSMIRRKTFRLFSLILPVLPFLVLMALPPSIRILLGQGEENPMFYLMIMGKVTLSAIALGTVVDLYSALYLVDGLLHLGLPSVFNRILGLTFRYFHMIQQDVKKGNRALVSRGILERKGLGTLSVFGEWIGGFFLKSATHGERVYTAMVSRGFQGETESGFQVHRDLVLRLAIYLLLGALLFWIDGKLYYGLYH